jgi:hypothetical protein
MKAQSDSTFHACLFPESSFTLGAASIYGLGFSGAGVNARAYYNLTEQFCFGPEVSFLSASDNSLTDINIVAHYIFDIKGIGVYPVGGINYSIEKTETEKNHVSHAEEAWGIVTGIGIHRNFKRITLFTEYSHHFGNIPDDLIALGVLITFHSNKNHKQ